ncbi:MAG: hypothetical protein HY922_13040 [Elusimicrobia bacterium]|nr:hypothetical protein [Elusimicrobiota bacterium]
MKTALLAASLAVSLALPAAAQEAVPMGQVINLSLVEALVAVEHADLSGIFGFVPEEAAGFALADFLMRDHKSLKRFIQKCEKDYKQAHGTSLWDKQVLLHLVTINASGAAPMGVKRIPAKLMDRVNTLSLVDGLPLEVVVQRRGGK